jgi:hypothetical protein
MFAEVRYAGPRSKAWAKVEWRVNYDTRAEIIRPLTLPPADFVRSLFKPPREGGVPCRPTPF